MQNKKYTFLSIIIAALLTFTLTACAPAEEEAASPELTDQPQGYLINNLIPAIPGQYKRVFNSRTISGYNPTRGDQVTILLLGLDTRGLSDALVLVTYNPANQSSAIISLKRDIFVDSAPWAEPGRGHNALGWASYIGSGYGGSNHIGGGEYTSAVIESLLGIKIDAFASINFDGFVSLIDALGGVKVNVHPGFRERYGDPFKVGIQRLYGAEALIYARHRQNPRIPEPGSPSAPGPLSEDSDRVRRGQKLLKAVLEQSKTLPSDKLLNIYHNLDRHLHTNMDDWELLSLANILFNNDPRQMNQIVLPGEIRSVYETEIQETIEYYYLDFAETDIILNNLGLK
jgi:LCP family protein required for cell wall assembly